MGQKRALVKLVMQIIKIMQVPVAERALKAAPHHMIPFEEATALR